MDCSPPSSSVHGDSPGQNTRVGCHAFLQGIFPTQGSNSGLLHCRWILYRLNHQGIPRILEWVPYPFSRRTSRPRNWTGSFPNCKQILYQLSYLGNPSIIWIFWINKSLLPREVGLMIQISTVLSSCPFHLNLLCDTTANTYFMYMWWFNPFKVSSVSQLCPTLCCPTDWSTPGFLVFPQLLELAQAHVHRVGDALQPSHPLSSPSPSVFTLPTSGSFPVS